MIGRLSGILIEKQPSQLLIDVNGVTYELEVPLSTFHRLPIIGERLVIFTHFVVREDAQLLYGFLDRQEQQLFRSLIKVNNVGPKLAITILSGMVPEIFVRCVLENDTASLVRLPGVGRKTAERLIVEMRDRLADWVPAELERAAVDSIAPLMNSLSSHRADALKALMALGYKAHEANRAVSKVAGENLSSEEIIRLALQQV